MPRLRLVACQLNTVVGDLDGNVDRIVGALADAERAGGDLAVFPELAITGYPPEDLLSRPGFITDNLSAVDRVMAATGACAAVFGFVDIDEEGRLFNAAAVCANGEMVGTYHKRLLPNYSVFDEQRWFAPGTEPYAQYVVAGVPVGVSVCEDVWFAGGPVADQGRAGARLVVNLNASPYSIGRRADRLAVLADRVTEAGCAIAYVNQVGGQDELVFDGASVVVGATGELVAAAGEFVEEVMVVDLELDGPAPSHSGDAGREPVLVSAVTRSDAGGPPSTGRVGTIAPVLDPVREVYEALVLGTGDYVRKNGFTDAVIGLSGGIDSSLVAAIAVDALGAEHVHGVAMPSRYSSSGSIDDALSLAQKLGIDIETAAIDEAHRAMAGLIGPLVGGEPMGLTDENLQSRIRGVLLMALSNANGWIVLTTGNKSEMATGYSTLYGDSAGGFAVIKDVPKTLVYQLCRDRNRRAGTDLIPEAVLIKPPSAELRPEQRDDESLPPYDVLDPVLAGYVEGDKSAENLIDAGFDPDVVDQVIHLVDRAEYKRRQMPPGVRITAKAFGKDRRMPITNRYRSHVDRPAESSAGA
ncbi:MAG TPA: NAD+ synthase [Acidimicrobiales bacterium]|jgi:NAD+ synthase (glutamine-hydrolysing)|nr:NAD+ synthase [Acidimicrobiales bacterium]